MTRKPRDYTPYLRSEYARQHPSRPLKEGFNDEVLALLSFVMRQIDPTGKKPVIEPPGTADGVGFKVTARGRGMMEDVE